ncbi:MAG TPA: hypothetical protein VJK06_08540 [Methyloceanibacter sp.]|jgi:hypothetical protein|nr:hypothetical protein [Methyloceanibacter sp.]
MNRKVLFGAICAMAMMSAAVLAADTIPWPWASKSTPDPALAALTEVGDLTATIEKSDKPLVAITVTATAPTPDYSDLQLVPRMGDPKDLIFAFDAKGRPPQNVSDEAPTQITISAKYSDAPTAKVGVIEIYGQKNCKAFSIADNKPVECTSKSMPQQ